MKNYVCGLFFFCSGLLNAQSPKANADLHRSGIRLVSEEHTVLNGNIASANSYDVIAYSNYHSRMNNCLSPFLILEEPVAHNLLMAHMHVHFVGSEVYASETFNMPSNSSYSDDDYSRLDALHYSSLFTESASTPSVSGNGFKGSPLAFLAVLAYQVVTADHNWGGYPASK